MRAGSVSKAAGWSDDSIEGRPAASGRSGTPVTPSSSRRHRLVRAAGSRPVRPAEHPHEVPVDADEGAGGRRGTRGDGDALREEGRHEVVQLGQAAAAREVRGDGEGLAGRAGCPARIRRGCRGRRRRRRSAGRPSASPRPSGGTRRCASTARRPARGSPRGRRASARGWRTNRPGAAGPGRSTRRTSSAIGPSTAAKSGVW